MYSQERKIEEPLVGWIVAETTRVRNRGSYMALLTYNKDIHMIMIDHAIGNQMIDVVLTASTADNDMCQEENNDYGEQVYETACRLAATTLVLVGPDSIIAY